MATRRRGAARFSGAVLATVLLGVLCGPTSAVATPSTGGVVGWGVPLDGGAVPVGLTGVVAVAAGPQHSLALKSDGTVLGWGRNDYGQAIVPSGLSGVVGIAASVKQSLAVTAAGTVVAWGYGTTVPPGLSGVVAVAVGGEDVALKSDGTVVTWFGDGVVADDVPAGLTGVTAISAGYDHTLALKSDGTVVGWGPSPHGEASPPPGLAGVVAISAGDGFSVATKSDGTVVAWGDSSRGRTAVPPGLTGVTSVSAGGVHALARKSDGTVVAWGENTFGVVDVPPGMRTVVAVSAGWSDDLAILANAPPHLEVPSDMTVVGDAIAGAPVAFTTTVSDPDTPGVAATCVPASGSTFPVGSTTVTCSASDGGYTARAGFTVTVKAPPGPAAGVTAKAFIGGTLQVQWTAPPANGSPVDMYGIFAFDAGGYTGHYATATNAGAVSLVGLTDGHLYYGAVYAHSALGWGPPALSGWVAPGAPTKAPAAALYPGDAGVYAVWDHHDGPDDQDYYAAFAYDADGYTGHAASGCASCNLATITGLENGHQYYVMVYSHNRFGWSEPTRSNWVTAGTPIPPSRLRANSFVPTTVDLYWSDAGYDNGTLIDLYVVAAFDEHGVYAGKYALACWSCRTATIDGLSPDKWYSYALYAHNRWGWGVPVGTF